MIGEREYLQLSMQISQNIHTTMELRSDLNDVEDQMAEVMDRLSNVVTRLKCYTYIRVSTLTYN